MGNGISTIVCRIFPLFLIRFASFLFSFRRTAWVQNPGWNPAFCKYSVSDYSCEVIKVLLEELDLDGNKTLDLDEFRNAVETNPLLREASSEFPAMDIQTVFEQFDTDGSGTISSEELRNFLMQKEASCGRLPCS